MFLKVPWLGMFLPLSWVLLLGVSFFLGGFAVVLGNVLGKGCWDVAGRCLSGVFTGVVVFRGSFGDVFGLCLGGRLWDSVFVVVVGEVFDVS